MSVVMASGLMTSVLMMSRVMTVEADWRWLRKKERKPRTEGRM
jgi:hypothetical protein